MLNQLTFEGNAAADAEQGVTQSGAHYTRVRLLNTHRYPDAQGNWQDGTTHALEVSYWADGQRAYSPLQAELASVRQGDRCKVVGDRPLANGYQKRDGSVGADNQLRNPFGFVVTVRKQQGQNGYAQPQQGQPAPNPQQVYAQQYGNQQQAPQQQGPPQPPQGYAPAQPQQPNYAPQQQAPQQQQPAYQPQGEDLPW